MNIFIGVIALKKWFNNKIMATVGGIAFIGHFGFHIALPWTFLPHLVHDLGILVAGGTALSVPAVRWFKGKVKDNG